MIANSLLHRAFHRVKSIQAFMNSSFLSQSQNFHSANGEGAF